MFMYNPIGKTLVQVNNDCGSSMNGYSVFILLHEDDTIGKQIGEGFSVAQCLNYEEEYAHYVVKLENDFFGQTVLRAIHPDLYRRSDN